MGTKHYQSLTIMLVTTLSMSCWAASTATLTVIPERAKEYIPFVNQSIDNFWPTIPFRSYIPALIEQETCITLTHRTCWNTRAELKTSREYGFGLGQFTIAYRADGAVRFNAWEEIKRADPKLKSWAWEDRFNPYLQISAIIVKNRINWNSATFRTANDYEKMAFVASTYNGGSTFKDRQICSGTPGCDASRWFGHVELHSYRSKIPEIGYKKSFFDINREYVVNTIVPTKRRLKYEPWVAPRAAISNNTPVVEPATTLRAAPEPEQQKIVVSEIALDESIVPNKYYSTIPELTKPRGKKIQIGGCQVQDTRILKVVLDTRAYDTETDIVERDLKCQLI